MKARPRRAERKIAEILSDFFSLYGYSPVERVPVIGRTGPDLQINDFELIVDVKSRLEVPKGVIFDRLVCFGDYFAVPLEMLGELPISEAEPVLFSSVQVDQYYNHMDEWTVKHHPSGITALVLHRPKMPFGKAMFILKNRRRFVEKCQKITQS